MYAYGSLMMLIMCKSFQMGGAYNAMRSSLPKGRCHLGCDDECIVLQL